jgi:hypothetical protein
MTLVGDLLRWILQAPCATDDILHICIRSLPKPAPDDTTKKAQDVMTVISGLGGTAAVGLLIYHAILKTIDLGPEVAESVKKKLEDERQRNILIFAVLSVICVVAFLALLAQ